MFFLGNFVPSQNLPRVFVPYSDGPGLNERDFREEFAQIRQRFAKLRLKILSQVETPNAGRLLRIGNSTPIQERIGSLDSPHQGEYSQGSDSKQCF